MILIKRLIILFLCFVLVCPALVVPAAATSDHVTDTQFDMFVTSLGNMLDVINDNIITYGDYIADKTADIRSYLESQIRAWIVVISNHAQDIAARIGRVKDSVDSVLAEVKLSNQWYVLIKDYLYTMLDYDIADIKNLLTNLFNGEEGVADDFNNQVSTDATEFEENMDIIQDVTRPSIEDIELDVDKEIPEGEVVKVGQLLGIFFQNQYIYIVFFIAFTFSLVSYGIFGKR